MLIYSSLPVKYLDSNGECCSAPLLTRRPVFNFSSGSLKPFNIRHNKVEHKQDNHTLRRFFDVSVAFSFSESDSVKGLRSLSSVCIVTLLIGLVGEPG